MRMQSVSIIVLLLLSLFSCKPKQIKQPECPLITPDIYERDKRQVADCIMRNIEYIRANHHVNSIVTSDVANFYEPYTVFYNEAKEAEKEATERAEEAESMVEEAKGEAQSRKTMPLRSQLIQLPAKRGTRMPNSKKQPSIAG